MRLTVSVASLRVGDFLLGSQKTVTGLGIIWKGQRTVETRKGHYVSTGVWNASTTMAVERSGALNPCHEAT